MIIKDKTTYLNYIQDVENKVKKLYNNIGLVPLSDVQRQSIEKICAQIFSKTALLSIRVTATTGFIPNSDWIQFKQEVNGLYEQLSNTVNAVIAAEEIHTNITR